MVTAGDDKAEDSLSSTATDWIVPSSVSYPAEKPLPDLSSEDLYGALAMVRPSRNEPVS